jgi:hypothetical protein
MVRKRMFSREITDHANFQKLPLQCQAVYLHLGMNADDDGFIGNPLGLLKQLGAKRKHLKQLVKARFVLEFQNAHEYVVCIKHWRKNNARRSDRYTPTRFSENMRKLTTKTDGTYTLATKWQPGGNQTATSEVELEVELEREVKERSSKKILLSSSSSQRKNHDDEDDEKGFFLDNLLRPYNISPKLIVASIPDFAKYQQDQLELATSEALQKYELNKSEIKRPIAWIAKTIVGCLDEIIRRPEIMLPEQTDEITEEDIERYLQ